MIALLQRVNWARVEIDSQLYADIKRGLLVFVGLQKHDTKESADKLLDKILSYRVFADADEKMNLSLTDIEGELLLVSQFTLAADTNKGLRPSFSTSMPPTEAKILYEQLVSSAKQKHQNVKTGKFGADMKVALENDGPVTFTLTSLASKP